MLCNHDPRDYVHRIALGDLQYLPTILSRLQKDQQGLSMISRGLTALDRLEILPDPPLSLCLQG